MSSQEPETVRLAALRKRALSFGKVFFDRVEVRAVGREEQLVRAGRLDPLAHGSAAMAGEIVHDHNVAGLELGNKYLSAIGLKPVAIAGAVRHRGATIPLVRRPATNVVVLRCPWGTAIRSRSPFRHRP